MSTSESFDGNNCTGNEGATNRTLTLNNSRLTLDNQLKVYVDGFFLHNTNDFTISHLSSNSTIIFLNSIFNSQKITVIYQIVGPNG